MSIKNRKEVDFYQELSSDIYSAMIAVLPAGWSVAVVDNTERPDLPQQVDALCDSLGVFRVGSSFPRVLPDIVLGVLGPDHRLKLAMFEVKGPKTSVGLIDYSQMFGYLHSAELIACGVLLLVEKHHLPSPLSLDLRRVIDGLRLPCHWTFKNLANDSERTYRSGIASFLEGSHIRWIDLSSLSGICSWSDLAHSLLESDVSIVVNAVAR
ncbi:MAG: hypothetical protein ACKOI2_12005 [Actinomycetota bacterium]